jgi:hypothetical protein
MNYRVLSEGPDRELWLRSMANDLGRLTQGVGQRRPAEQRFAGTDTVFSSTNMKCWSGAKSPIASKKPTFAQPRSKLIVFGIASAGPSRFSPTNGHPDSQPHNHKNSHQQHYLHAKCQVY